MLCSGFFIDHDVLESVIGQCSVQPSPGLLQHGFPLTVESNI